MKVSRKSKLPRPGWSGQRYGADLDWGIELSAEALAGGQKVAKKAWSLKEEHIYYQGPGEFNGVRARARTATGEISMPRVPRN